MVLLFGLCRLLLVLPYRLGFTGKFPILIASRYVSLLRYRSSLRLMITVRLLLRSKRILGNIKRNLFALILLLRIKGVVLISSSLSLAWGSIPGITSLKFLNVLL